MDQQELKKAVGQAALQYVKPGEILGVGTGSTVDCFIDALKESGISVPACVSSSVRSTNKLQAYGFKVLDLNEVEKIGVYVDGADEIDPHFAMIKGGGGALTREKIVAMVSERFVCIADESKKVDVLGKFPLPIEVIPMAVNAVAREIENWAVVQCSEISQRITETKSSMFTDGRLTIRFTGKKNSIKLSVL